MPAVRLGWTLFEDLLYALPMHALIHLGKPGEHRSFLGSRYSGNRLRLELEAALDHHDRVVLDFADVGVASQSFIDELIGVLILQHGPDILRRLTFKNCNEDVRAVIRYVVNTRTKDVQKQKVPAVH